MRRPVRPEATGRGWKLGLVVAFVLIALAAWTGSALLGAVGFVRALIAVVGAWITGG